MKVSSQIYLNCKKNLFSKKGFKIFIICIGIFFFLISWKIHSETKYVVVNENWTKERSNLWINIYKPCMYYRYRSSETGPQVYTWLLSEFSKDKEWEKGMQITSGQLSKAISLRDTKITAEKLNTALMYWSLPHSGEKYAQNNLNNFSVLVRSRANVKQDQSHNLHYKVSVISKNDTIVELWNYWSFH